MLPNVLKGRIKAIIFMAGLFGAFAGSFAALSFAQTHPERVSRCDEGVPLRAAICLVNDAVERVGPQ